MEKLRIERLRVSGFLSFADLDLELGQVNVLIGSNGSGKSNLMRVFELLQSIASDKLPDFVARLGGADAVLHYGRKHTEAVEVEIHFLQPTAIHRNGYSCRLIPTAYDELVIHSEKLEFHDVSYSKPYDVVFRGFRSVLVEPEERFENPTHRGIVRYVRQCLASYQVYHFHDTTPDAKVKQHARLDDTVILRSDASNLAAILYRMREEYPLYYHQIVERVRDAAPFFGDFVLEPTRVNRVLLRWHERGRDTVFSPDALSDGTLRYICLMTLLHQPPEWMPATILIDEPELGLHPYAINLLAGSLRMASAHAQILAATQSPLLLDSFAPEEVLVAERGEAGTTIRRLNAEALQHWLEDYSMGEIWEKNLIGGRPPR